MDEKRADSKDNGRKNSKLGRLFGLRKSKPKMVSSPSGRTAESDGGPSPQVPGTSRKLSHVDSERTASTVAGDTPPPPGNCTDSPFEASGPPPSGEQHGAARESLGPSNKGKETTASSNHLRKSVPDLLQGAPTGKVIQEFLVAQGLSTKNCRMSATYSYLKQNAGQLICGKALDKLRLTNNLVERAFTGKLAIPDFQSFRGIVHDTYHSVAPNHGGNVADYIPSLARAEPDQFGVAVCSIHGQQEEIGDVHTRFSIQSTSKPITYGMALELYGPALLDNHVSHQPSGRSFNERVLMHPEGIPHNPCINAGAIMTASFVKFEPSDTKWDRVDYVMRIWDLLCADGSDLGEAYSKFQYATFLGEQGTAARNNSLAWMMEEQESFPVFGDQKVDLNQVLDAYFAWCSIELTCRQMSIVAATLANGGMNPLTQERVFMPSTVKRILSVMFACGMYDYSGEFAYQCGLPTKSGVGGALLIVIPGKCGIATFSPRLDAQGNSVRGVEFCQTLSARMGLHCFSGTGETPVLGNKKYSKNEIQTELFWASHAGDVARIGELVAIGADVNFQDYDGRTALHLAACTNEDAAARKLLNLKAHLHAKDRYNNTPLDDSRRELADQCLDTLDTNRLAKGHMDSESGPCPDEVSVLFSHFHCNSTTYLQLAELLAAKGLLVDGSDPRLSHLCNSGVLTLDMDEVKPGHIVHKALTGGLTVPNWDVFTRIVSETMTTLGDLEDKDLVEQTFSKRLRSKMTEEHWCKVLPEGSSIPGKTFGAACWTCDGQFHDVGDANGLAITVSTMVWPVVVLFLKKDKDFDINSLGNEPSSQSEDSLCLNTDGKPYNAFMLPGELAMCEYLVTLAKQNGFKAPEASGLSVAEGALAPASAMKLLELTGFLGLWREVSGSSQTRIDENMYEKLLGNFRVWQAVFYLLDAKILKDASEVDITIGVWCALRSIQTTTSEIAFMGTVLASRGVHPFTGQRVFDSSDCQSVMSLLFACGGDWAAGSTQFLIGLPVKTARNGLCLMVVPDVLAVCVVSPVCHLYQNSLRGTAFLKAFSESFGLHIFEKMDWNLTGSSWDLRKYWGGSRHAKGSQLLNAAANDDICAIQELLALGFDINYADYDGRTPIHVAAAESQERVVEFLLGQQANPEALDRWGRKPLDDAIPTGCEGIISMLTKIGDGTLSSTSGPEHGNLIEGLWTMRTSAAASKVF